MTATNSVKITKSVVDRLPPGTILWDSEVKGFGVRRQHGDGRFYLLLYRIHGRQRYYTIGRHGSDYTADTARKEAFRLRSLAAQGIDPARERDAPRPSTFGEAIERYLTARQGELRPRTYGEASRYLRSVAKPLHRLTLAEIDLHVVADFLGNIKDASGAASRNRARSALSAFFRWAMEPRQRLCTANPCAEMGKDNEGRRPNRVLADGELAEIWAACHDGYGDIVRLCVLTGCRREEIGGLSWGEIADGPDAAITLPAERVKNKREHHLPLSPLAQAIIAKQPRRNSTDHLFGRGDGCFAGWSRGKAELDARILAARRSRDPRAKPMPAWRLHDLRHTLKTWMQRERIPKDVRNAVQNHTDGDMDELYGHHTYAKEKREVLDRWAAHVAAITGE